MDEHDFFTFPPENYFRVSNAYVDQFAEDLTSDEFKVLMFAIRHIRGFHEKYIAQKGAIAMSVFVNGWISKKGYQFGGVGLAEPTIRKCLKELVKFGFLVIDGKPTQDGQVWLVGGQINRGALKQRTQERAQVNTDRTSKARETMTAKRSLTEGYSGTIPPLSDNSSDPLSDNTPHPLSDNGHIKTLSKDKRKKKETTSIASDDANVWPESFDENDVTYPFVEERLSSVPSKTKRKSSARTDNHAEDSDLTTAPLIPRVPPADPSTGEQEAPPATKSPAYPLLTVIARAWRRNEGFCKSLIPQLRGTAKEGKRSKWNIEPAMTTEEIFAYRLWWDQTPERASLPVFVYEAESLYEAVNEFRGDPRHDDFVRRADSDLRSMYGHPQQTPHAAVIPAAYEEVSKEEWDAVQRDLDRLFKKSGSAS